MDGSHVHFDVADVEAAIARQEAAEAEAFALPGADGRAARLLHEWQAAMMRASAAARNAGVPAPDWARALGNGLASLLAAYLGSTDLGPDDRRALAGAIASAGFRASADAARRGQRVEPTPAGRA